MVGVAEGQREPERRIARVGIGEEGDGVLRDAVTDPDVRIAGNSFDVDDTVRCFFLGPNQRSRLRYCNTTSRSDAAVEISYVKMFKIRI